MMGYEHDTSVYARRKTVIIPDLCPSKVIAS